MNGSRQQVHPGSLDEIAEKVSNLEVSVEVGKRQVGEEVDGIEILPKVVLKGEELLVRKGRQLR